MEKREAIIFIDQSPLTGLSFEAMANNLDPPSTGLNIRADQALSEVPRHGPVLVVIPSRLSEGRDGFELVRQVRQMHPEARILVLADDSLAENSVAARNCGANGLASIAASLGEIVTAIQVVRAGQGYWKYLLPVGSIPPGAREKRLSVRQRQVYQRIQQGKTYKEIADQMELSERTVESYAAEIKNKLGPAFHRPPRNHFRRL